MSTMESLSMRKRQTILVDRQRGGGGAGTNGTRVNQNFAARDSGRRRVSSAAHGRTSSRQVSSSLEPLPEPSNYRGAEESTDHLLDEEVIRFGQDPDGYVLKALAGASIEEIRAFRDNLQANLDNVVENEQSSFRNNYESMRTVARAIAEISMGVGELRKQIGELQVVSDAIRQDAVTALETRQTGRRSRPLSGPTSAAVGMIGDKIVEDGFVPGNRRQSMLMLNTAWTQDLHRLFSRVEGAQKYLPALPGRHVVLESVGWQELNLVTLKPVKSSVLFLLNDHLLVATPKPRLVVDKCWPLAEITIEDTDNAIRVWSSSKSTQAPVAYRATNTHTLGKFMDEFVKTREQFLAINQAHEQAQMQLEIGRRGSVQKSNFDRAARASRDLSGGIDSSQIHGHHKRGLSSGSTGGIQEASVEEQREAQRAIADIDRDISHHRYADAVSLCLEHSDHRLIQEAVAERRTQLGKLLLEVLRTSETSAMMSKQEKIQLLGLLVKLDLDKEARQVFLESVTEAIEARTREVHFVRDVVSYISQMAVIYFQMIKAAVEVYRSVFKRQELSSFIVTWAKSQVDLYASVFDRQLYRIPTHTKSYKLCMEVSRQESSQLQELSMDMDFMLRYVWAS